MAGTFSSQSPVNASKNRNRLPVALATQVLAKNLEDSEKARKIAELQAQIRAKLSGKLASIIPPVVQDRPKPLILDDEGRTIDKSCRAVNIPTLALTLKIKVKNIIQKKGTTAFAVTEVEIVNKFGGDNIEEFNVNRPYIFFIVVEGTSNMIFAGKVLDPTA